MNATDPHPFGAHGSLEVEGETATIYRLGELARQKVTTLDRLPFSIRVLLENTLRHCGRGIVTEEHVERLGAWSPATAGRGEVPYMPARVVLQDFTGVPCVVDLAAMRDAMARMGGDPDRINPVVPCDLVIDHSVQVDHYGSLDAFRLNVSLEFDRNRERYQLLKFAQQAFRNFRVVPPGTGIVHQVNLEYLASVVQLSEQDGALTAFPDSLVGTDSHTTMINGLGVMGWGVGGIEAEAVMLGQPYFMVVPEVVGVKLVGEMPVGTTATDLVLHATQLLRGLGVVDKFVEFYGSGLSHLSLADRATIANMAPEYGATMGFFPVDDETLAYLRRTGRDPHSVAWVDTYCKAQGLFRTDATPDPDFSTAVTLDLGSIEPSLAGPRRPQDLVPLASLRKSFAVSLPSLLPADSDPSRLEAAQTVQEAWLDDGGAVAVAPPPHPPPLPLPPPSEIACVLNGESFGLHDGSVVIAAITSCTNTSNPSVMVGAGLVAQKAVERGLRRKPWVKSSMAPGSRVVTDYLDRAGLQPYLDQLGFQTVGYGCTTCIGNSGPLPAPIAQAIEAHGLVAVAVLSGNRNYEARVHPQVRASYLASPMLVVAFALAGRIDLDLEGEPLGEDAEGRPVFLRELWPSNAEIQQAMTGALTPDLFTTQYATVFEGDEEWQALEVPEGSRFEWDPESTYVREPPFFVDLPAVPEPLRDIHDARVLVSVGNTVTTDHISPAGAIPKNGPAARFLREQGVEQVDWNTFGARRGNHDIMMRGTFGNVRLKNLLVPGKEGNWTEHLPSGEVISIFDAAMRYRAESTSLIVLAGKEYGAGSSRDWAAKGTTLLGVRAVLTESFERIHRSNLVGMGVLPLGFIEGQTRESLGLTGRETFSITGIAEGMEPGGRVAVRAVGKDGDEIAFDAVVRLNSPVELDYYRHGGILSRVLRHFQES